MTIDLRNLPSYLTDNVVFRAWGQGISAQLAAIGLVKTTDTGQINWTTVLRPSGAMIGYEIWRFNDSLQATKPVFVKIEFGTGGSDTRPALRLQVATAVDGAGNLGGQVGASRYVGTGTSGPAPGAMLPSYCSGSPNRLNLITNFDTSNSFYAMTFLLERTKSADGVSTDDGIVSWSQSYTSSGTFQVIPFSGSVPIAMAYNNSLGFDGQVSMVGTKVALSPTVAFLGKPLFASWCTYRHSDIGELVPFTMEHLGEQHTFMPMGDGLHPTYLSVSGAAFTSLAMLWD